MDIIETSIFTRLVAELLSDDEYRLLQSELCLHPEIGKIIPSTGGLRKFRWRREDKGKRGGFRVIYYWFTTENKILMLYIYPKNKQDDLSSAQLKVLRKLVEQE
jgi:hypothetical protein